MKPEMNWPDGRSSACMVTVEIDDEFIWLSMDPSNANRPKTLSMGTYGMLRGFDRVMEALEIQGVRATFFVPGKAAKKYPEQIRLAARAGHEIGLHGYEHENFGLLTPTQQEQAIARGIAAIEDTIGRRPVGFRLPEGNMTPETLDILHQAGFLYDSSMLDSDLPYEIVVRGEKTKMVEIPMRWDMQDFIYFAFNFHPPMPAGACRIANYNEVYSIWRDELEGYCHYGLCYVCKFDPQCIGTPGRISILERLLQDMNDLRPWIATGEEIARHFISSQQNEPPIKFKGRET